MIKTILLRASSKSKQIFDKLLPSILIFSLIPFMTEFIILLKKMKINKAKRIFNQAISTPVWLKSNTMEAMLKKYPPQYIANFDVKSLQQRGKLKMKEIIKLIKHDNKNVKKFLELGCNDGLVCYYLHKMKKEVVGIDIQSKGFNKMVIKNGVKLIEMDASKLQFEDESFDFIYSYNAFEHFLDPQKVLQEAIRVLKKKCYIFISFEPVYSSAWGLHLWNSFPIPYGQYLFPESLIKEYLKKNGKSDDLKNNFLNRWSVDDYRNLWKKYSNKLKIIKYREYYNVNHLDLIMKYPFCFKSKTNNFDNLIIKKVMVVFEKIN